MENSPFNKLSAELRNQIWNLCIPKSRSRLIIDTAESEQPVITRICKQMRNESLLMFYAQNSLCIKIDFSSRRGRTKKEDRGKEFLDSIQRRWLKKHDMAIHKAVKGLNIAVVFNRYPARTDHPFEQKVWTRLAYLLAEFGYFKPRIRADVRAGSVHLGVGMKLLDLRPSKASKTRGPKTKAMKAK